MSERAIFEERGACFRVEQPTGAIGRRATWAMASKPDPRVLTGLSWEVATLIAIVAWVAPCATMIAAMMTAANLGARLTGWGFVVFTFGSVGWAMVGLSSGQANLVATNCFLTLVNGVGIWRWLGRQRIYEDGGKSAAQASRRAAAPSLFTATGLAGMPVVDNAGDQVGKAVEALVECTTGEISYVVVASGLAMGIGEALRAVPREAICFGCNSIALDMPRRLFDALEPLDDGDWPVQAQLGHTS